MTDILASYMNGQLSQMVSQIKEYGVSNFVYDLGPMGEEEGIADVTKFRILRIFILHQNWD